ncbi:hypothetical protein HPG69_002531 [Diceros bicornis minor]|uniref:Beta-defensin n=1 Tax=Diceros bicornis minor TaxID=77932 RepID=A0A7J7FRK5_DICBM|nr:hypothetical protein HPG69_002531 [Diceros bicornis minor]
MKIPLFFSILFFFGVFVPPVGSDQHVNNHMPSSKTKCSRKFETLYSKLHTFSTIFEKAQYATVENDTARSKEYYPVFNWWNACRQLGGQCKNKCGDKEFGMSYCARPTTHCCLKECDPME